MPSSGSPVAVPSDGSEPKAEGLHYTGYVDDIRVAIASAWVTVVPLRAGAGGTRLKVLESMALGTPLVSTAIGYEGVASRIGRICWPLNPVRRLPSGASSCSVIRS